MQQALNIQNLQKTYKNGTIALNGIDLSVEKGDFFALLGPNGAGKTTTIGIITSLVNKTGGSVAVFGDDITENLYAAKSHIGVVPQEFNFSIFEPVWQIVINSAGFYGVPYREACKRAEHYLKKLDLWDKRKGAARNLSGGMKRRLMIARAMMHEPKLLILDEPTAGVDVEIRRSMWDFLTEINHKGTTIILTTHYLEEAEKLCKNIAIIDHGKIIEHTSMDVLLEKLTQETYVFKTKDIVQGKSINLPNAPIRITGEKQLEIDLDHSQTMNSIFNELAKQGIEVMHLRNKANRLEELFLSLTHRGEKT